MKLFYHDHFVLPLPQGHRFPMEKYSRLRERLENDAQTIPLELLVPESASLEQLCLAHDRSYVERVFTGQMSEKEMRRIGFPPDMHLRIALSFGYPLDGALLSNPPKKGGRKGLDEVIHWDQW